MYLITRHDVFFRMSYYFAVNHYAELCDVPALPGAKLYHVDVSFIDKENNFDVDGLYIYSDKEGFAILDKALYKRMMSRHTFTEIYRETCCENEFTIAQIDGDVEDISAALKLSAILSLTQQQRRDTMPGGHQERPWTAREKKTIHSAAEESSASGLPKSLDALCKQFNALTEEARKFFGGQHNPHNARIMMGGVMTDAQIANAVLEHDMINPFFMDTVREVNGEAVISYGLGTMGYDTRLRPIFKLFKKAPMVGAIDPKAFDERHVTIVEGDVIELPPKTYALSETVENFNMPNDVMAFCLAKSTYARCCIGVNTTPVWPGFKGHVVIEFYNHGDVPVKIYANEGFAQFVFMRATSEVTKNYADRGGVYHGQTTGVQSAKVGKK